MNPVSPPENMPSLLMLRWHVWTSVNGLNRRDLVRYGLVLLQFDMRDDRKLLFPGPFDTGKVMTSNQEPVRTPWVKTIANSINKITIIRFLGFTNYLNSKFSSSSKK